MTPHTRYILKHRRGSMFSSILPAERLGFAMETLAVVHASSEGEVRARARLVLEGFAGAGTGYLPGPEHRLARVA
jgi:hypothetical protein